MSTGSSSGPLKAFNSTPGGKNRGRLSTTYVAKTRCTAVIDGEVCNAFPSWQMPWDRKERRCEKHMDRSHG